jgi:hypothetical protein
MLIPVAKARAKIACTIDPELLGRVERLRASTGESRSAVIGRALARLMEERTRAERIRRYMQAYREHPESVAEERSARKQARRALAELAWDDE